MKHCLNMKGLCFHQFQTFQLDTSCIHYLLWNRSRQDRLYMKLRMLRRLMMKCQKDSLCTKMSQPWLRTFQLDKECMHHQILWNRGQLHKLYTMLRRPTMKCQQHSLCIQMSQPWLKIYLQYRKCNLCSRFFH